MNEPKKWNEICKCCGNCANWTGPETRHRNDKRLIRLESIPTYNKKNPNGKRAVYRDFVVPYKAGDCKLITDERDAETFEYCGTCCRDFVIRDAPSLSEDAPII